MAPPCVQPPAAGVLMQRAWVTAHTTANPTAQVCETLGGCLPASYTMLCQSPLHMAAEWLITNSPAGGQLHTHCAQHTHLFFWVQG